jgi:hypothetical protein
LRIILLFGYALLEILAIAIHIQNAEAIFAIRLAAQVLGRNDISCLGGCEVNNVFNIRDVTLSVDHYALVLHTAI